MNPEQAAIRNIDGQKRIDGIKVTAEKLLPMHTHLKEVMEMMSIHPENFGNCYDRSEINSDQQYVARMNKIFQEQAHERGPNGLTQGEVRKLAELLEYQIISGINI